MFLRLFIISLTLLGVFGCGKKDSGGSSAPVREIAVGGDLALNRAVSRVKPANTTPVLAYHRLKEYNNSIQQSCPLGGYYQGSGNTSDNDQDGVFPGGAITFAQCIFQIPNEYAIPVYAYLDGSFIGVDPNDNNPYVYKAILYNFFILIYIQDPTTGEGYFFADMYDFDTLSVNGQATGVGADESGQEFIGWGQDTTAGAGGAVFCEYMGQDIDTLGAEYKPDDGQFTPNDYENANYYAGGFYLYSYENYQSNNTCDDKAPKDTLGASLDVETDSNNQLHDATNCKYDPSQGGSQREFNSGKARLKNRIDNATTEISYGSDCKSSFSGAGLYGYVPAFGPKGGILSIQKFVNYKLKTTPSYKLFSNQSANINLLPKFQEIKQKTIQKAQITRQKFEIIRATQ